MDSTMTIQRATVICEVEGCEREARFAPRGEFGCMCPMHYKRWLAKGHPGQAAPLVNRTTRRPCARRVRKGVAEKRCNRCNKFFPEDTGFHGTSGECKPCHALTGAEWREANREKAREGARHSARKYRLGVTKSEYLEIIERAQGLCEVCGCDPERDRPEKPFLAVDHNHATGEVRGALCYRCNIAIGHMEDDPDRLIAAARYLQGGDVKSIPR